MCDLEEWQWVEACRSGDTNSFGLIVTRYERMVRTMISRLVRDYDLVDELAHQTFISAYEHLDRFNGQGKLSTWLGQIALNKCRDHLRAKRRREAREFSGVDVELLGKEPDFETQIQGQQNSRALKTAMDRMDGTDRDVIVLRYLYEHDYKTIAKILNCSKDAAKVRSSRAITTLRGMLTNVGAET